MKKTIVSFFVGLSILTVSAAYRQVGNGTELNVWTANYSGVVSAANQTGYPILLVMVNSVTCGHCHTLYNLTLSSSAFRELEAEEPFYCVMIDQALVSDKLYRDVWSRYSRYFNDNMFPLIAVLRKDGSVYNSYGNRVTDVRNVAGDVRQWVKALAQEQLAGGGTVTPTPDPLPTQRVPTVADVAARLNGKAYGVALDAAGHTIASVVITLTARGKVTMRLATIGGNTNVRATLELNEDGDPQIVADGLSLVYDESAKLWRGKNGDTDILAAIGKPSSDDFDGLYTARATSSDGKMTGYVTVTVKNGKGKVQGQVNGNMKLAANGTTLAFDANSLFVPIIKKGSVQGSVEIGGGGALAGNLVLSGADMALEGAKWDAKTPFSAVAGLSLVLGEDTSVPKIPLVMQKGKIAAAANDYRVRFTLQPKKGMFKGNAMIAGKNFKFSGVMVKTEDRIMGFGTAYGAGVTMPVWVE